MEQVNEGTTSYLTVTFKDKLGVAEAPASATWKVTDLRTGSVLQAETQINNPGSTEEITIPPSVNRIVNAAWAAEVHRLTVTGTYNAADAVTGQYDFTVNNLSGVAIPAP